MVHQLRVYQWPEESLDGEVTFKNEHVIVEDSQPEQSPSTKAERQRRRDEIGRRYILGHVPLIQSASLRGPFNVEKGWLNPWKHTRSCSPADQHSKARRSGKASINKKQSAQCGLKSVPVTAADRARSIQGVYNQRIHNDARPYDADTEDDYLDEYFGVDNVCEANTLTGNYAKSISLSTGDDSLLLDSKRYMLPSLGTNLDPVTLHQNVQDQDRGSQNNYKKRKADVGWLKRTNVLKRSRYNVFEQPSPTRAVIISPTSKMAGRQGASSSLQPPTTHKENLRAERQAKRDTKRYQNFTDETFCSSKRITDIANHQNEQNLLVAVAQREQGFTQSTTSGDGTRDLDGSPYILFNSVLAEVGRKISSFYDEEEYGDLDLEDANGLQQASCLAFEDAKLSETPLAPELRHIEAGKISASSMDATFLLDAQKISRQSVISGVEVVNHQSSHGQEYRALLASDKVDGLYNDSAGMASFRDTPSPSSEQSFQYRKIGRIDRFDATSPEAINGLVSILGAPEGIFTEQVVLKSLETFNGAAMTPQSLTKLERAGSSECSSSRSTNKDGTRQILEMSSDQRGSMMGEITRASSPDPLSDGFTSNLPVGSAHISDSWIAVDEPAGENLNRHDRYAEDQKSELATTSHPSSKILSEAQQLSFHNVLSDRVSKQSTSETSGDYLRLSVSPASSQPQLAKGSDIDSPSRSQINKAEPRPFVKTSREHSDLKVLEQSPWIKVKNDFDRRSSSPDFDSDVSHIGDDMNEGEVHGKGTPVNGEIETTIIEERNSKAAEYGTNDSMDCLANCHLISEHSSNRSDEAILPFELLPGTQVLLEATTVNPWNSILKKPRLKDTIKRVSFGPLPPADNDSTPVGLILSASQRLGSPPPSPRELWLTHLDDPFYQKLKAFQKSKGTMKSTTNFMNASQDKTLVTEPLIKPIPGSPATDAMAEAFLAADRQSMFNGAGLKCKLEHERPITNASDDAYSSKDCSGTIGNGRLQIRSSSPFDESFSIAPNGQLTAVNLDSNAYDPESNLEAVIEDMGSFLEGWDVEIELKKAKGARPGKVGHAKSQRERGYLSGISNR